MVHTTEVHGQCGVQYLNVTFEGNCIIGIVLLALACVCCVILCIAFKKFKVEQKSNVSIKDYKIIHAMYQLNYYPNTNMKHIMQNNEALLSCTQLNPLDYENNNNISIDSISNDNHLLNSLHFSDITNKFLSKIPSLPKPPRIDFRYKIDPQHNTIGYIMKQNGINQRRIPRKSQPISLPVLITNDINEIKLHSFNNTQIGNIKLENKTEKIKSINLLSKFKCINCITSSNNNLFLRFIHTPILNEDYQFRYDMDIIPSGYSTTKNTVVDVTVIDNNLNMVIVMEKAETILLDNSSYFDVRLYEIDLSLVNASLYDISMCQNLTMGGTCDNYDMVIPNKLVNRSETGLFSLRRSILNRSIRDMKTKTLPQLWSKIKHIFLNHQNEELLSTLNCAIARESLTKEKSQINKLLDLCIKYKTNEYYKGDINDNVDYVYINEYGEINAIDINIYREQANKLLYNYNNYEQNNNISFDNSFNNSSNNTSQIPLNLNENINISSHTELIESEDENLTFNINQNNNNTSINNTDNNENDNKYIMIPTNNIIKENEPGIKIKNNINKNVNNNTINNNNNNSQSLHSPYTNVPFNVESSSLHSFDSMNSQITLNESFSFGDTEESIDDETNLSILQNNLQNDLPQTNTSILPHNTSPPPTFDLSKLQANSSALTTLPHRLNLNFNDHQVNWDENNNINNTNIISCFFGIFKGIPPNIINNINSFINNNNTTVIYDHSSPISSPIPPPISNSSVNILNDSISNHNNEHNIYFNNNNIDSNYNSYNGTSVDNRIDTCTSPETLNIKHNSNINTETLPFDICTDNKSSPFDIWTDPVCSKLSYESREILFDMYIGSRSNWYLKLIYNSKCFCVYQTVCLFDY